jgi:hypothetical protein
VRGAVEAWLVAVAAAAADDARCRASSSLRTDDFKLVPRRIEASILLIQYDTVRLILDPPPSITP